MIKAFKKEYKKTIINLKNVNLYSKFLHPLIIISHENYTTRHILQNKITYWNSHILFIKTNTLATSFVTSGKKGEKVMWYLRSLQILGPYTIYMIGVYEHLHLYLVLFEKYCPTTLKKLVYSPIHNSCYYCTIFQSFGDMIREVHFSKTKQKRIFIDWTKAWPTKGAQYLKY